MHCVVAHGMRRQANPVSPSPLLSLTCSTDLSGRISPLGTALPRHSVLVPDGRVPPPLYAHPRQLEPARLGRHLLDVEAHVDVEPLSRVYPFLVRRTLLHRAAGVGRPVCLFVSRWTQGIAVACARAACLRGGKRWSHSFRAWSGMGSFRRASLKMARESPYKIPIRLEGELLDERRVHLSPRVLDYTAIWLAVEVE